MHQPTASTRRSAASADPFFSVYPLCSLCPLCPRWRAFSQTVVAVVLSAVLLITGCVSQHLAAAGRVESPNYTVPPQQLAADVKRIVSSPPIALAVTDQGNGVLVTDWQQPFRGDWHILRFWHERTRYHITIVPDFGDPAHRSRVQIADETEQRPDESGPNEAAKIWHPAPDIHRPERSEALLHQIESGLDAVPPATRTGNQ